MYLHLGQGVIVPEADVIGVFDLDNTTGSHITRKFLNAAEKTGRVINISEEMPNSFVVCGRLLKDGATKETADSMKIYLSQLSSQTLMKRFGEIRPDW